VEGGFSGMMVKGTIGHQPDIGTKVLQRLSTAICLKKLNLILNFIRV
jgi:hypothetical protein